MPQIKLDNLPGLPATESIVTDPAVSVTQSETFDTHLERAQPQPLQEAAEVQPAEDDPRGDSDDREDVKPEETTENGQPEAVEDPAETDRSEPAETDEAEISEEENGDENVPSDDKETGLGEADPAVDAVSVTTDQTGKVQDKTADNVELKDDAVDQTALGKAGIAAEQSAETSVDAVNAVEAVEAEASQDELQQEPVGELTAESGKQGTVAPDAESRESAKPQADQPQQDTPNRPQRQDNAAVGERTTRNAATVPATEMQHVINESAETANNTTKSAPTVTIENQANTPTKPATGQISQFSTSRQTANGTQNVRVDRARFVQRVAKAFQAMGNRSGSVRIRLSPPELGSLRVDISVRNGMMSARVEAENLTTRNLLLDNLPALRDRLAQQDIKIEQFDVELADRSHGGLPDDMAGHAESDNNGGGQAARREVKAEAEVAAGGNAVNRPGEGTQLNVVI